MEDSNEEDIWCCEERWCITDNMCPMSFGVDMFD